MHTLMKKYKPHRIIKTVSNRIELAYLLERVYKEFILQLNRKNDFDSICKVYRILNDNNNVTKKYLHTNKPFTNP